MRRGRHYATFALRSLPGYHPGALGYACLGVLGPGFDPTTSGPAHESSQGWVLDRTGNGVLWHDGRYGRWDGDLFFRHSCKEGDVVVWPPLLLSPRVAHC